MAIRQAVNPLAQRCAEIAFEQYAAGNRSVCVRSAMAALTLQPGHPSRRGLLSITARSLVGSRAVDRMRQLRPATQTTGPAGADIIGRIQADPTNPQWHADRARQLVEGQRLVEGYACLRTALALARRTSAPEAALQWPLSQARAQLGMAGEDSPPPERLLAAGDPYGRMQFLARRIAAEADLPDLWVLDVGGGNGFMSVLLPRANYVLVEPVVNGISGLAVPFADKTFDVVLLAHSLEHVDASQREALLLEAMRAARRVTLILGPWVPAAGRPHSEEAIVRATGAPWAKEHLAYGLPVLSDTLAFLDRQGVRYDVTPHADARVMYWQYLATHFGAEAGEDEAVLDATAFFQRHLDYRPAEPNEPHDFLVTVWVY